VLFYQTFLDLFQNVKEKLGCLDIVCNNAGIGGETHPLWEKAVDVNMVTMHETFWQGIASPLVWCNSTKH
jgi:NAD(P)-dependent dehydrogenase (short-subunit alcohol dehydrogenase family)